MDDDHCSNRIIGAAIEVHRLLGPGLLESAYEAALAYELREAGLHVVCQPQLAIWYKNIEIPDAYRLDLVVNNLVVVEVKSVEKLSPLHTAQLSTYLRFSRKRVGLLLNFNSTVMRYGIKRLINSLEPPVLCVP